MRLFLTGAALLLATTASAATADLKVTLDAPTIIDRGATYTARATVENLGPDAAPDTKLYMYVRPAYVGPAVVCHSMSDVVGTFAPGEKRVFECSAIIPGSGSHIGAVQAHAHAQSAADDPFRQNNAASVIASIASPGPDVIAFLTTLERTWLAPALPVPVTLHVLNVSRATATGLSAVIEAPYGFGSVPPSCTVSGTRAMCALSDAAPLDAPEPSRLTFEVLSPDEEAKTSFEVRATVTFDVADINPDNNLTVLALETIDTIFVTSTADAGAGTLRAAIEDANKLSEPTLIAFRIGEPAHGWHSIHPLSSFPRVTSSLVIVDGTTQTGYFGDTNPLGPEIEIDGSETVGASGLELYPLCAGSVRGLAIHSFDGPGILAGSGRTHCIQPQRLNILEKNYLGIDATGTRLAPNGRGLVLTSGYRLRENVISGNIRAGVFATAGGSRIERNIIGLGPKLDRPMPNGASGIYVGPDASGTWVDDNFIGFNREAGLAIGAGAVYVGVHGNSFLENGGLGIDYGIDGPSPDGPVAVPEIVNATFVDGRTIIEGRTRRSSYYSVTLYANDRPDAEGYGEGQYYLGEVEVLSGEAGTFRFAYDGDLRGKFIAATITHLNPGPDFPAVFTSEFSRAVEVE